MKNLINKFAQAHKESALASPALNNNIMLNYDGLSEMVLKIIECEDKALESMQQTIKSFIKEGYSDDKARMAFNFQACIDYILFMQGKPNKATFM